MFVIMVVVMKQKNILYLLII